MSESFGRYLKRERKLREIPLEEIARETKIKVGLLRALEDDRIEELPSPAIVKGFLRAYARMLGLSANDLQLRYQAFLEEVAPDRIVLDVPDPWEIVEPAGEHLPGGGVFACYVPNIPQVEQVRAAIDETGLFLEIMSFEVMMREWSVSGRSVRPSHRMVGHTGFLTVARKVLGRAEAGSQ